MNSDLSHDISVETFNTAAELVKKAGMKGVKIATSESCTGGLIGGAITAIPGSSDIFIGGIIAYNNKIKTKLLGVPPSSLGKHGAVSEIVAKRMAAGAVERLGVDLAVSVTGIAGPKGGSKLKPVGTVWIGVATKEASHAIHHYFPEMSRNDVRDETCLAALKVLIAALDEAF